LITLLSLVVVVVVQPALAVAVLAVTELQQVLLFPLVHQLQLLLAVGVLAAYTVRERLPQTAPLLSLVALHPLVADMAHLAKVTLPHLLAVLVAVAVVITPLEPLELLDKVIKAEITFPTQAEEAEEVLHPLAQTERAVQVVLELHHRILAHL
jgi:hypothetical protein